MNPELFDLDLPEGEVPEAPARPVDPMETERWQMENRRLRLLRGDHSGGFCPVDLPFVIEGDVPWRTKGETPAD